jgi:hypothetical protein
MSDPGSDIQLAFFFGAVKRDWLLIASKNFLSMDKKFTKAKFPEFSYDKSFVISNKTTLKNNVH